MLWLVGLAISSVWTRSILGPMNGFGVPGKDKDPKYAISQAIDGWDPKSFGFLVGPAYSFLNAALLLLTGTLADK